MRYGWKIGIGLVILYLAAYLVLSVSGGYEPGKAGRFTRYSLPTYDIYLWQLRYGRDSPFHGYTEFIPAFFSPLLWSDRKLWHRELPMLRVDESGEIVDCPAPPTDLLHPRMLEAQKIFEAFAARHKEAKLTESSDDDVAVTEEMLEQLEGIGK